MCIDDVPFVSKVNSEPEGPNTRRERERETEAKTAEAYVSFNIQYTLKYLKCL